MPPETKDKPRMVVKISRSRFIVSFNSSHAIVLQISLNAEKAFFSTEIAVYFGDGMR